MKTLFAAILSLTIASWAGVCESAPYYAGKTIRIVIGFSPGGGNDLFAGVISQYLGRHIAGAPTVIVENRPGAGGAVALNWFAGAAPRDGTVLMVVSGSLLVRMALGASGVGARIDGMEPLIAGPTGRTNYVSAVTGYKKPKDILRLNRPLFLGVTDPLGSIGSIVGLTLLKVPFKTVQGYPGKNDALLSIERGETTISDIPTPIFNESVMQSVRQGKVVPLYTQGIMDGDRLVRDPANLDLPSIQEFYHELYDQEPTGPSWQAYKAVMRAISNSGKNMMVLKEAPAAAVDSLRDGFAALLQDRDFLENARAAMEGYSFTIGDGLVSNVAAIGNMDTGSKKWLRDLYSNDYGLKFN